MKFSNNVIYDEESDTYYQRRRVDNQTIELGMNCTYYSKGEEVSWFNIYITIFNKRKDMYDNMDKKIITGQNPFKNFVTAHDMFYDVEAALLQRELVKKGIDKVIIFCTWVDNRRRDAYYRVLSRHGYYWGKTPIIKEKCIMKIYTQNDVNPEVYNDEEL